IFPASCMVYSDKSNRSLSSLRVVTRVCWVELSDRELHVYIVLRKVCLNQDSHNSTKRSRQRTCQPRLESMLTLSVIKLDFKSRHISLEVGNLLRELRLGNKCGNQVC